MLLPLAIRAVRGDVRALWRGRWRILGMALIGVAGTQLAYFAALERVPVSTALLIEYTAPILLVAGAAVAARRLPRVAVLAGSAVALAGLALVIGPVGGGDPAGYLLAGVAAVGCALYYVIAARPADGLPPVALAAFGLLLGAAALALVGMTGALPLRVALVDVAALGGVVPWWVPLGLLALTTAVGYRGRHHRLAEPRVATDVVHRDARSGLRVRLRVAAPRSAARHPAVARGRAHPRGDRPRSGSRGGTPCHGRPRVPRARTPRSVVPAGAVTLDPCGS